MPHTEPQHDLFRASGTTEDPHDGSALDTLETAGSDAGRWSRRALWASAILAITPIIVAALRNGFNDWTPTLDAATTATRTRDVLSAHPPLVGMWSAASSWSGLEIHFPGALQLYLLTVPIHLLGNTWGVLLGMATLNSIWILTTGWLLHRRLGVNGAIVGFTFVALFVWTMGSEVLVDITPMQMVTIPFALFLVAVWSVADGDLPAIPILVFVANYLLLDHLTFTLLVPVIGLTAIAGLVHHLWRTKRVSPDRYDATVSRTKAMIAVSGLMTMVLWAPPLWQQLTGDPPNITNLLESSGADRPSTASYADSAHAVVSILTKPPFWFRDSFRYPTFGSEPIDAFGLIVAAGLLATFAGLAIVAARRKDFTAMWALVVAVVAALASFENIVQAPNLYGFRPEYLHSLWGMAMFAWLAIALAVFRLAPRGIQLRASAVAFAVTVIVTGLAIPHRNLGASTTDRSVPIARELLAEVIPELRDKGIVRVDTIGNFESYAYSAALILAMNTEGIPYCVGGALVQQYGREHDCINGMDYWIAVGPALASGPVVMDEIARSTSLDAAREAELDQLRPQVSDWLAGQKSLEMRPSTRQEFVTGYGDRAQEAMNRILLPRGGGLTTMMHSQIFVDFIVAHTATGPDGSTIAPLELGSLDDDTLTRWAKLEQQMMNNSVTVWGVDLATLN